ncbi:MAG: CehA/McbA family metallohydrolase [Acidobacteriota bacterium]
MLVYLLFFLFPAPHEATIPAAVQQAIPATSNGLLGDVQSLTTADDHYDKYVSIAYDRTGSLCAAYTSMHDVVDTIVFRCTDNRGWSAEQRVDAGQGLESNPRLMVDASGDLWLFWHGVRAGTWSVFARHRSGAKWGPEQRLSAPNVNALHATASLDSTGRIWVAFEVEKPRGFAIEVVSFNRGRWSSPRRIDSDGSDRRPSLASSKDGHTFLAWDSTRTGNFDIFMSSLTAVGNGAARAGAPIAVTSDATIDDSPSLAVQKDGSVWIAWNGMRSHAREQFRTDRHGGDAFVRIYRDGAFLSPPPPVSGAMAGQVSSGAVNKTPRDAVDPYWHWKQTQNYPMAFVDSKDRVWIIWRTDATGAHNFDLWARVHDGKHWSDELHLTDFSPGRDEFPVAANAPDGHLQLAWEGQALPAPGELAKFSGGDVDLYNTLATHNVILTGSVDISAARWFDAPLAAAAPEVYRPNEVNEPMAPGPPPGTAMTADGRYHIYFGDPHSHSVLSDAKTGFPDQLLYLGRDHLGFDFDVVSDHAEMGRLQATEFAEVQLTARAFTEAGRFVSLSGWEWTAGPAYGHRVILFRGEPVRPVSSQTEEGSTIEKLYAHVRGHDGVMSPHHTGHATWGRWNPDAAFDEMLEPNFEIASWHGRGEYYGNPHEGRRQVPGHQYQDALRRGRHVGVMAASDTHHLTPGEGGLTAVLAESLDRASIFDAIRNRRNYATTGARIVLEFTAGGAMMGSRIKHEGPLEMTVRVEGTAAIDHVEIVRNLIDSFAAIRLEQNPGGADGVYLIYVPSDPQGGKRVVSTDTRSLTFTVRDVAVPAGETSYYVRVTQADGEQAWSSPIWVTR